jgi:hypothetical protein
MVFNINEFNISLEGTSVHLIHAGAAIKAIRMPDRNGNIDDVVLGHGTINEYSVSLQRLVKSAMNEEVLSSLSVACHRGSQALMKIRVNRLQEAVRSQTTSYSGGFE